VAPRRHRLLLIGNFFRSDPDALPGVCVTLADSFVHSGHGVRRASAFRARTLRLAHMTAMAAAPGADVAIIEVYSGAAFTWAAASALAARASGKRVVLVLHGGLLPEWGRRRTRRIRSVLRLAHALATPSHALSAWARSLGFDARVIDNPIRLERFELPRAERSDGPRLFWMRALHPVYDPKTAVRALALVLHEHPDARLELAGPDRGLGRELRSLARELGVAHAVDFTGKLDAAVVAARFASAHVYLNTTTAESFGISVMEAAAAGTPVVTTPAGELALRWRDGESVLFAPVGDAAAFAAAICRLLDDPALSARLADRARQESRACDWSRVEPRWRALLDEVGTGEA
jgi:glycosyltransferase involved in cell wall biosynthesis